MSRSLRSALSFLCAGLGWVVGMCANVAAQGLVTADGTPREVEGVALWSALFVLATWLCAMLPLALFLREDSRGLGLVVAWPFGALWGMLAFLLLFAVFTGREVFGVPAFYAQAALTGAVAW